MCDMEAPSPHPTHHTKTVSTRTLLTTLKKPSNPIKKPRKNRQKPTDLGQISTIYSGIYR